MVNRNVTKDIIPWIRREEIIFLNGPRQVGKTTLLKFFQKKLEEEGQKTLYLNLENPNDLALTENYERFLNAAILPDTSKITVFIDEIQLHSRPSNFLKFLFDEHRSTIKLFVSGSANLDLKAKLQDSLVGRKKSFSITPFTFSEFLEAKNFASDQNPMTQDQHLEILLEEYLLYGGLPRIVLEQNSGIKQDLLNEYTGTYISRDIRHMIVENHVVTFNNLLIFLSKMTGCLKNNAQISKELSLNSMTLSRYLDLLQQTFIVQFLKPYFTNEMTRTKKASKVYFFDNGVRNSLLSNFSPLEKRNDAGALFENVVFLHLKEQYDEDHIFYLRNASGNEVDFVCQGRQGEVNLYEAKYSRFDEPRVKRGYKELMKMLQVGKATLINKNLNYEGPVRFVSFEQFAKTF